MNHKPYTTKEYSKSDIDKLPTAEDIAKYEESGWHITPKILTDIEIENAIQGVARFYKGINDYELEKLDAVADDVYDESKTILNNEFTTLRNKELRLLGFHKLLVATAAMLARTSSVRLFADSLITKRPTRQVHQGAVGWHSDKAYWPTCTSDSMLTAWIPLQDVTLQMGPLMHIDGSHKWRNDKKLREFYSFNNQDLEQFDNYLKAERPDHKREYMTLKKGQVSFHNCHTIHSSYPNTSDLDRVALAVHYQDHTNKYQKAYKDNGELISIGYDKLCKISDSDDPNYADPKLFPVLAAFDTPIR